MMLASSLRGNSSHLAESNYICVDTGVTAMPNVGFVYIACHLRKGKKGNVGRM